MINLTNLNEQKFIDVAEHWGEKMPMMLMEECGELIQAVSKYERCLNSEHPGKDISEIETISEALRTKLLWEIRDVYISLEAIKHLYSIDDNELNGLIEEKLNKKY